MSDKKLVQLILFLGLLGIISGISLFAYRGRSQKEVIATDSFIDYQEALKKKAYKNSDELSKKVEKENEEILEGGIEILDESLVTFDKEYKLSSTSSKPLELIKKDEQEEKRVTYYVVKRGDSLYKISKEIGVDMNVLVANNPSVKGGIIRIGQKLKVLNDNSIEYVVKKGDSLIKIANKYNVKLADLLKDNDLNTTNIIAGYKLLVKNPDLNFINRVIKKSNGMDFRWPIKWAGVTSPYGKRFHPVLKRNIFHKGVDLRAPVKTPLYAPADGVIRTAGWLGGYGKIIIIKHSNGYETREAHLNNIYVKVGQKVKKGQLIGRTGKTGRVTGPHLHFEIRKNGKTLNPIEFKK